MSSVALDLHNNSRNVPNPSKFCSVINDDDLEDWSGNSVDPDEITGERSHWSGKPDSQAYEQNIINNGL